VTDPIADAGIDQLRDAYATVTIDIDKLNYCINTV
jgi:hypothetical protein